LAAAAAMCLAVAGLQMIAGPAAATTIPPGSVTAFNLLGPTNSADKAPLRVPCPAGQRVLGGGVLTAGGAHVIITEAYPVHDSVGDAFIVTAVEDQFGTSVQWNVQGFAFCAVAPPGLEIIPKTNPAGSPSTDQALAVCSPGKFVIGSGGRIVGGQGQVDLGLNPNNSSGLANGSAAHATEDADGFSGTYQTTGYAICATQNVFFDFQMVRVQSPADTAATKKVTVFCPSGYRATGAGGTAGAPGTHLQFFRPNTKIAPSFVEVFASSSVPISGPWSINGIVYCAK